MTIQAERAAEGDPRQAPQALRDVADAVRDSLDEVRRIARELRPEALDDLGLVNALIALCNRARRARTGRASSATCRAALPPLPPEVELVLYRIAQESLTNAVRHANAHSITPVAPGRRRVGDAARARRRRRACRASCPRARPGIAGMRERAILVGGRFSIESIPRRGTEVRLRIPLDHDGR